MKHLRLLAAAALAGVLAMNLPSLTSSPAAAVPVAKADAGLGPTDRLSVMTYNVEGLPFPVRFGRAGEEEEIGRRLAQLRQEGRQPHVVLLQEAFIPQAKAIASAAGYTHIALGPQTDDAHPSAALANNPLATQTSWLKGEGVGKWVDSGLVILSDYPIVQARRMAFPQDLCAGYDCLAAKGVLLAWIKVPGQSRPIAIADTHLNSRQASGVSIARANDAYSGQIAAARAFIRTNVPASEDVIFGGDFNVGHDKTRIMTQAADGGMIAGGTEATQVARYTGALDAARPDDAAEILQRGKDKQYFRAGSANRLALRDITVPFGIASGGNDLSDHLGYIADYAI